MYIVMSAMYCIVTIMTSLESFSSSGLVSTWTAGGMTTTQAANILSAFVKLSDAVKQWQNGDLNKEKCHSWMKKMEQDKDLKRDLEQIKE